MKKLGWFLLLTVSVGITAVIFAVPTYHELDNSIDRSLVPLDGINRSLVSINRLLASIDLREANSNLARLQIQLTDAWLNPLSNDYTEPLEYNALLLRQTDRAIESFGFVKDTLSITGKDEGAAEASAKISNFLFNSVRPLIERGEYGAAGAKLTGLVSSDSFQFLIAWQDAFVKNSNSSD